MNARYTDYNRAGLKGDTWNGVLLEQPIGAGSREERQHAAGLKLRAMSRRQPSQAHLGVQHELQLAAELAQARAVLRAPRQRGAAVAPRQALQDGVRVRKDVHVHQLLHQAAAQHLMTCSSTALKCGPREPERGRT